MARAYSLDFVSCFLPSDSMKAKRKSKVSPNIVRAKKQEVKRTILGKDSNEKPSTKELSIAPVGFPLQPADEGFTEFCLNRLAKQKVEVETGKRLVILMLGHSIPFTVKSCTPEKSVVNKHTKLVILSNCKNPITTLENAHINIFMTDDEVKKILSSLIKGEFTTKENAVAIWKEFKKGQKKLFERRSKLFEDIKEWNKEAEET